MTDNQRIPLANYQSGGLRKGPPGLLRTLREQRGLRLVDVVAGLNRIAGKRNWKRGGMNKSELSRAERDRRWLRAKQLATLATYYRVPAGELAEGLLRELGLVPRERARFAGSGGVP